MNRLCAAFLATLCSSTGCRSRSWVTEPICLPRQGVCRPQASGALAALSLAAPSKAAALLRALLELLRQSIQAIDRRPSEADRQQQQQQPAMGGGQGDGADTASDRSNEQAGAALKPGVALNQIHGAGFAVAALVAASARLSSVHGGWGRVGWVDLGGDEVVVAASARSFSFYGGWGGVVGGIWEVVKFWWLCLLDRFVFMEAGLGLWEGDQRGGKVVVGHAGSGSRGKGRLQAYMKGG